MLQDRRLRWSLHLDYEASQVCVQVPAMWVWAGDLPFMCHSDPVCKIGIILSTSSKWNKPHNVPYWIHQSTWPWCPGSWDIRAEKSISLPFKSQEREVRCPRSHSPSAAGLTETPVSWLITSLAQFPLRGTSRALLTSRFSPSGHQGAHLKNIPSYWGCIGLRLSAV